MHSNTALIMKIENEAIDNGWYDRHPRTCFCEEVARRSNEMGNNYPSDKAIKVARRMLNYQKRWKKKNEKL